MTHILLIDDDDGVLDATAELLELEGFKITKAVDGKEGLQKMESHIPDLVLCDILMPKMDGLQLLQEMGKRPKLNRIPFIFFSAKSENVDIKNGLDMGADDYLTKPFELEDLLRSIDKSLQKKKEVLGTVQKPNRT
jgi:DNA-binding response OmpR family regulator